MNMNNSNLKYIALKMSLIDADQRNNLLSVAGNIRRLASYLDEINVKFPQLDSLSRDQKKILFKRMEEISVANDEWLLIRRKMDSMKADGIAVPEKLYSLLP